MQHILSDLCDGYAYNNETTHIAQLDPDQNIIDAWHRYLQVIKNEMESIKPIKPLISGTVLRDQGIFKLSRGLIEKLIKITKETTHIESTPSSRQLKTLRLLEKLTKEDVDITFNDEDLICLINMETFNKAFYNSFFLFLNYDNSTYQAATYNTSLQKPRGFMTTISLNNSLLYMVGSKGLPSKIEKRLTNFLDKYRNAKTEKIAQTPDILKTEGQSTQSIVETQEKPQTEIQDNETKNPTIEGEIIELNDFQLACIVLHHKENNILQKLSALAELHRFAQKLKL